MPPADVLAAWLAVQDLLEPASSQVDDGGTGGRLRCAPLPALRSDVVLFEGVAAAGGSADVGELDAALRAAGYSAPTQLARTCPVLVRVGRGRYAPW